MAGNSLASKATTLAVGVLAAVGIAVAAPSWAAPTPHAGVVSTGVVAGTAHSTGLGPAPYAGQWDAAKSTPEQDPIYPQFGLLETDVLHYHLGLNWDGSTLNGVTTATTRATKATSSLRYNLHSALKVSGVTVGGQTAQFTHTNNLLTVTTGSLSADAVTDVVISYSGQPQSVPMPASRGWKLGWQSVNGGVYTLQQPYGAYTWYPSNDHPSDKAFYDATITTSNGQMGVFNGVLADKQVNGTTTVTKWHLDAPACTYVTTIGIDAYQVLESTLSDGKKLFTWHTAADSSYVGKTAGEYARAYDWMIAHAGPYPYSSSGIVITVGSGAMETQQMITLARSMLKPSPTTNVIHHELSHQWFGNAVSPSNWKGTWLNEGWAKYMEMWYGGNVNVNSAASRCRGTIAQAGQAGNPKPNAFAEGNVYSCPVPALDAVRKEVGDAKFIEAAAAWPATHLHRSVDRATFLSWLNSTTGKKYDDIFAQWLDRVSG